MTGSVALCVLLADYRECARGAVLELWVPFAGPYLTKLATWFPDDKLKNYFAAQRRIVEIGTALLKQHREKVAGAASELVRRCWTLSQRS